MSRSAELNRFLLASGFDPGDLTAFTGDASNRRYFRLLGSRLVVMDSPPEKGEDVRPFIGVTEWLRAAGFSAPRIHAMDVEHGFLVLEDLGDDLFRRICEAEPGSEKDLYANAVDLLAALRSVEVPAELAAGDGKLPIANYDEAVLLREADLLTEWYLPAVSGTSPDPSLTEEYRNLVARMTRPVAEAREVVVLRDYHAENLLWLPGRTGTSRTGLLDYQDALVGHPAYDLVSLLEDARRDTSEALREAMIARYLAQTGDAPGDFRLAYCVLGAQRNLKIIGIFSRLCLRDGKSRYPDLIPRVWAHLMRDLAHPELAEMRRWVERHVPAPEPALIERMRRAAGSKASEAA
ncbi:phosphotransferase [Rhodobacteraceae bacterium NNCM2]|nr:phosphotransferase [Coraliihabitans acroporae]